MTALLQRVGLAFADPDVERAYRRAYRRRSLVLVRVALAFGLAIWIAFGALDRLVAPELVGQLWAIRYGAAAPVLVFALVASLVRVDRFLRWMPLLVGAAVLATGLGIVAMTALCGPPASYTYFAGLMLVLIFGYVLSRMGFLSGSVVGATIVVAYEVVAFGINPVPVDVLVSNNFFLLSTNAMGMFAGFVLERLERRNFTDLQTIREMSTRDHLTGLYNRRKLDRRIDELASLYRRYDTPTSLLLLDLDGFKGINDRLGHPAGDRVLQIVAEVLAAQVRETDLVFRYGGDEFCVLLPSSDVYAALRIGARLQRALEARPIHLGDETIRVRLSGGCVGFAPDVDDARTLIARADEGLLVAKRRGKGRILAWPGIEADRRRVRVVPEPAPCSLKESLEATA